MPSGDRNTVGGGRLAAGGWPAERRIDADPLGLCGQLDKPVDVVAAGPDAGGRADAAPKCHRSQCCCLLVLRREVDTEGKLHFSSDPSVCVRAANVRKWGQELASYRDCYTPT